MVQLGSASVSPAICTPFTRNRAWVGLPVPTTAMVTASPGKSVDGVICSVPLYTLMFVQIGDVVVAVVGVGSMTELDVSSEAGSSLSHPHVLV